MKILFVNPACPDPRVTDGDALVVPLGLYYLCAQMMEHGVETRLLNLAPHGQQAEAVFAQAIAQEKPDIIGFSVTNPGRMNAQACAGIAKKQLPQALILFGGPAPTFLGDHLFQACPELDVIIKGEGEAGCLSLVRAMERAKANGSRPQLGSIPGLEYRRQVEDPRARAEERVDTGPAPVLEELDDLPHPARHFAYQHLAMSRGCPGKCTFCGSPKFWSQSGVRFHSVDWFFQEIQLLVQRGVTHFFISDDTFTMDRDRVIQLCQRIIEAPFSITWNAISRVDQVDGELFYWMRRAGCIQISFGVESGSDKIKKILGKPVANEKAVRAFQLARKYGIMPRAYFIYGSPGETEETIRESLDLMMALKPLSAVFYLLVIFPGTHLYSRAVAKGLTHDDIWHQPMEDLPWFELDPELDFPAVKGFGDQLRRGFYEALPQFVQDIELDPAPELAPCHGDFLSRLAMTFSHGEYAQKVPRADELAQKLFLKALDHAPDARAFLGLSMLHGKQRNTQGAMEFVDRGLDHHPGHRDLSICRGVTLMNQGRFEPALEQFKTISDGPDVRRYIEICNTKVKG
ncbi:MAG: radical SAM protein [Desulfobacterales bacterium]|nr:radical SAM protein [Desulfobacterales bacterium]